MAIPFSTLITETGHQVCYSAGLAKNPDPFGHHDSTGETCKCSKVEPIDILY